MMYCNCKKNNKHEKLLSPGTVALLIVILVSGALPAWRVVARADRQMRSDLIYKAQVAAEEIDIRSVAENTGTCPDLGCPKYQRLQKHIAVIRQLNTHCRFTYLLGQKAGYGIFYLVGSESPMSAGMTSQGQVFADDAGEARRVFEQGVPSVRGPYKAGNHTMISVIVPVQSAQTGNPGPSAAIALLGMDFDAEYWNKALFYETLPSSALALALTVILMAARYAALRRSRTVGDPVRRIRHIEPFIVIAVGTVITFFASWDIYKHGALDRKELFLKLADSRIKSVADEIRDIRDTGLEGLAKFCESRGNVTLNDFESYAGHLTIDPAVHAWAWIAAVPGPERARFEKNARLEGVNGYEIWQKDDQGRKIPASGREMYYPILYGASSRKNSNVLGFDLGSEPIRRKALEEAVQTRLVTATDPVTLILGSEQQKGAVIFRPVFDQEKPARLRGFALAVLRMGTLLKNTIPEKTLLMDISLLEPDGAPKILAATWAGKLPKTGLFAGRPVFAFGKVINVATYAGPGFMDLYPVWGGWWTLASGLGITFTVALLLFFVMRDRSELEALVTERTHELQLSEQSYRNQFTANISIMILVDPRDGMIMDANDAAVRFYGYNREQMLTKTIADINVSPESEVREIIATVLAKGGHRFESVHRLADGSHRNVDVTVSVIRMNDREVFHGIIYDITRQKKAEAYRNMAADVLGILNDSDDIPEMNQRILHAVKMATGSEVAGIKLAFSDDFGLLYSDDFAGYNGNYVLNGHAYTFQSINEGLCDWLDRDNKLKHICGKVYYHDFDPDDPSYSPGGSFWTDDYKQLCSKRPEGGGLFPDGQGWCIHSGYRSVAVVPIIAKKNTVGMIYADDSRKGVFNIETVQALEGIAINIGQMLIRKRFESELQVAVTKANEMAGHAENAKREILKKTELLELSEKQYKLLAEKLEIEVKETQTYLIHQEKLASIGHLAAGVAHEINNPMGFISSNLRTLRDYSEDMIKALHEHIGLLEFLETIDTVSIPIQNFGSYIENLRNDIKTLDIVYLMEDVPQLVSESLEGADRINKIVMDLKDFAHPGEENLTYADLVQCIDSTLNMVWNELKYKVNVIRSYSKVPMIQCYPRQLNQVIMNLLVNSAHAIENKGDIEISTRDCGDFVELSIRDTGCGIPEENLSRIFNPFFTTKEIGKGTGLGLNLAYNIINKHNGTIDVKSQVGIGTVFTIRIPVNQINQNGDIPNDNFGE